MIQLDIELNKDSYESCPNKTNWHKSIRHAAHPSEHMNHLSVSISDLNQNCPIDDSIYIHLAAKRLRPYRAAQDGDSHTVCLIAAGFSFYELRQS